MPGIPLTNVLRMEADPAAAPKCFFLAWLPPNANRHALCLSVGLRAWVFPILRSPPWTPSLNQKNKRLQLLQIGAGAGGNFRRLMSYVQ